MKTSLIDLFKAINRAKFQLIDELSQPHTPAEKIKIGHAINVLDQLATDILTVDLKHEADRIEGQVKGLKDLTDQINHTSDNLAHIVDILNEITSKIDAVLQAVSILSGVGLIAA